MTPAKERKAAERARRAAAGLKRLELWAHPEDEAAIRAHALKLAEARGEMLNGLRARKEDDERQRAA
jgi:hypothetical protein